MVEASGFALTPSVEELPPGPNPWLLEAEAQKMQEDGAEAEDPYKWVSRDVRSRGIVYQLSCPDLRDFKKFKKYIGVQGQRWRLEPVIETHVVCIKVSRLRFFVYSALFEKMMMRVPFFAFQKRILRYLKVAASQLTPTLRGSSRPLK